MTTVRDATLDVLRRLGGTTLFGNPGSTEISLLTDLPEDLSFVLALHEGSVVGMATGAAIASGRPAVVILHTTAGLGNAVGALATARVNRAPLVVIVGQQDRRHLALTPFLAGHRLDDLAGDYPVWVNEPVRAQDVPGAVARAWHQAVLKRGPAIVIVPMDDWEVPVEETGTIAAPDRVLRSGAVDDAVVLELAELVSNSRSPAIVVGAGSDDPAAWTALQALAHKLQCPVWQEAFGARAGFPQDHALFAGHLPPGRTELRKALAGHDLIVSFGAPVFRQYPREPGLLVERDTRIAVVTEDADEATTGPADLAVVASPGAVCERLAQQVSARPPAEPSRRRRVPQPVLPAGGEQLRPEHVFGALDRMMAPDTILVEETPSSRPLLHELVPARRPLGFLSAAMGGLGFGLPASIGVKMAQPHRPVIGVLGDGSSMYSIQGLWSAAKYGVGVLIVVLANGRYAIMDRLAERHGASTPGADGVPPWPDFAEVSISRIAAGLGCPARRLETYDEVVATFEEILPTLSQRREPLVVEVVVG